MHNRRNIINSKYNQNNQDIEYDSDQSDNSDSCNVRSNRTFQNVMNNRRNTPNSRYNRNNQDIDYDSDHPDRFDSCNVRSGRTFQNVMNNRRNTPNSRYNQNNQDIDYDSDQSDRFDSCNVRPKNKMNNQLTVAKRKHNINNNCNSQKYNNENPSEESTSNIILLKTAFKCQNPICQQKIYVGEYNGPKEDFRCAVCLGLNVNMDGPYVKFSWTYCRNINCNVLFQFRLQYKGDQPFCPNCIRHSQNLKN